MEEQFTQAAKIEEVEGRFAEWRKERKRGAAIPGALWDDAVSLCMVNSISKVCEILHLDYKVLKRRLYNAFPDRFSHSEVHVHDARFSVRNQWRHPILLPWI
jgi:hypothetical protein